MANKSNQSKYRLEHRLVGAVVLVLIAVIVIPLLLSEPDPTITIKTNAAEEGQQIFQSKVDALKAESELQERLQIERVQKAVDRIDEDALQSVLEPIEEAAQANEQPQVKLTVEDPVQTAPTVADENNEQPQANSQVKSQVKSQEPAGEPSEPVKSTQPTSQAQQPEATDNATLWEVRVGTFTKSENADALKELLKKAGFNAKSTDTTNSLGNVTRVWLGPYANRETADKIRDRLKTLTDQEGFVATRK